jgi:hypothetical protein
MQMEMEDHGRAEAAAAVARYLIEGVHTNHGRRWLQGPWNPPLHCASSAGELRLLAEQRLRGVSLAATRALLGWSEGRHRVRLLRHCPRPSEVLALQARGWRCVSLLGVEMDTGRHADGLAFALHDLCHLEKFTDPLHHHAQVGFFAAVDHGLASAGWRAFEAELDPTWVTDRDYVIADMNGSAVFLLAALKMKLKMAVRRRVARGRGQGQGEAPQTGSLRPHEVAPFQQALHTLFDALGLRGELRLAALAVSARRDDPAAAARLLDGLGESGRRILAGEDRAGAVP